MVKKRSQSKRRSGRGSDKKRITVTSIYKAIRKYPRSAGASVRDIHRFISKHGKGRTRKSLSSVKLAISRAVRSGSIRAPKGWQGFRGMNHNARTSKTKRQLSTRRGRRPSVRYSKRVTTARRRSSFRGKHANRRQSRSRRRSTLRGKSKGRARSTYRGARPRGVSRGRFNRRVKFRRRPRLNNNNAANISDNYNAGEAVEGETTSLWQAYTCIIS